MREVIRVDVVKVGRRFCFDVSREGAVEQEYMIMGWRYMYVCMYVFIMHGVWCLECWNEDKTLKHTINTEKFDRLP